VRQHGARVERLERAQRPESVRPEIVVRLGWYECQEPPAEGARRVLLTPMPAGPAPWEVAAQAAGGSE
jgi:hypothetical protein